MAAACGTESFSDILRLTNSVISCWEWGATPRAESCTYPDGQRNRMPSRRG
jgi:hypothetical protein